MMQTEIKNINESCEMIANAVTPPVDLDEVTALCKELEKECKVLEKSCSQ